MQKGKQAVWLMVGFMIAHLSWGLLATVPYMIILWLAAVGAIGLFVMSLSRELDETWEEGRWVLNGVVLGAIIRHLVIGLFDAAG